ncbi:hypothetical protein CRG98_029394 [Punica granatum]|uniref:Aminotransferase-like plant mobile domain-containing protein n=1 Tax=Punica granatum TaxID=22663 RepID=A0A2I0J1V9_PUNGR|nr:hypothetical protein CRG98_029394 [Punica granatum]
MDRSAPGLRLESITPPRQEIMRIWRTFRPMDLAFIQGIIGDLGIELTPTVEEYTTLIQRPNPFAVIRSQLSILLSILAQEVYRELHQGWDHGVRITWLLDWMLLRALMPSTGMRGSPHLLQVWLLAHIRPFYSSHPFSYITDERSLIARLVPVFPPPERSFSEWRHFLQELTSAQFLWVTRWNPGSPMIIGCPGIMGVPLLSHLGSTLVFPGRVIRQLDGLQDILVEADCLPYCIQWADSTSSTPVRFLQIWEIRRLRHISVIQRLYFPEHPTDEERAFSATSAYVAQFYSQDSVSPQRPQAIPIPRAALAVALEAESSA